MKQHTQPTHKSSTHVLVRENQLFPHTNSTKATTVPGTTSTTTTMMLSLLNRLNVWCQRYFVLPRVVHPIICTYAFALTYFSFIFSFTIVTGFTKTTIYFVLSSKIVVLRCAHCVLSQGY